MFRSIPANGPNSPPASWRATVKKLSGLVPQICAISGCSAGVWMKRRLIDGRALVIIPSTQVNSVKKRWGAPARATICRKTVSVTSSIGARVKIGLVSCCQIFVITGELYPTATGRRRAAGSAVLDIPRTGMYSAAMYSAMWIHRCRATERESWKSARI
jgi:hypothetical protein